MLLLSSLTLLTGVGGLSVTDERAGDPSTRPPAAALVQPADPTRVPLQLGRANPRLQTGPTTRLWLDQRTWLFGSLGDTRDDDHGFVGFGKRLAINPDRHLISEIGVGTRFDDERNAITSISTALQQRLSAKTTFQAGVNTRVGEAFDSALELALWLDLPAGVQIRLQHQEPLDNRFDTHDAITRLAFERQF